MKYMILAVAALSSFTANAAQIHFYGSDNQEVSDAVIGEALGVAVTGLSPGEFCTVSGARTAGPVTFRSHAKFRVDGNGKIDMATAIPESGTYSKADRAGLFWSMVASPGDPSLKQGCTFTVKCGSKEVAKAELPTIILGPGIKSIVVKSGGLVGRLFLPADASGAHPAMITFGGSEGGAEGGYMSAAFLASHGFVALGLGYFNAPGLPKDLANIRLEYFEKAIKFLQARRDVNPEKIGVMGVSRGGELALLLGATFPQIKAVVGDVPSPIVFAGNPSDGSSQPAWIYKGKALSLVPLFTDLVKVKLTDGRTAYNNRPVFEVALKDKSAVASAFIRLENINGPVLLTGGEDDQVWPSCDFIKMAMNRLKEKQHPFADQSFCYPNAGHAFSGAPGFPMKCAN
ncbi:MAG: acyl-CoA thioester hydrolase/BAAT C-terminal domain-containing protein, partial [Bdellovibrionota bacterium]